MLKCFLIHFKGQTPLFLGCREGSVQTVRHLLVNYANSKVADSMDMTPEDIAKQRHHHDIVELLTDWSLGCNSPKTVPAPTNVLSPLGSISPGISPADSTTLSPFQAPNSLDAQPPSPLEILSPDDLAGLEEVDLDWDLIGALDDPTDMSICWFTMNTSLGQGVAMDHTVPTTSDCLYMPVRPLEGQRLYSVHSTPDLPCVGLQPSDSRALVFNGRTCHSAQKAPPPISQQAAFQAIAYSNMYSHAGGVGGLGNGQPFRKDYQNDDYSMRHQQLQHMPHQLVFPADEMHI